MFLFQEWYELVLTVTEWYTNLQLRNLDCFGEVPFSYDVANYKDITELPLLSHIQIEKSPREEYCEALQAQGTDKPNAETKTHE